MENLPLSSASKAMDILQKIQRDISEDNDISVKLEHVMRLIATGFNVDASVCYTPIDDTYLELFCKYGIKEEYKGNVCCYLTMKMCVPL